MITLKTIARIRTPFQQKFGVPFQSNVVEDVKASIEFESEYRTPDALRGLDEFSHIWLLWGFSQAEREGWSPTVRPPKLGGNRRVGVFSTRSPYRPNAIGLSSVRIERIDWNSANPIIHVLGADMVDGTPIYDIKPYLAFTDSHPEAKGAFYTAPQPLKVDISETLLVRIPQEHRATLKAVLAEDPRPAYQQRQQGRLYGMTFYGFEVRFTVEEGTLTVREIARE